MENFSGIKELYDVNIRLNSPLEIGKRKYDINESILSFSTIEIAQISEQKDFVSARGGYHNPALVNWEVNKEMSFGLSHGVLSPRSWALLSNSQLKEPNIKSVSHSEILKTIEDDNYCYIDLRYCPNNCDTLGAQPNPFLESLPMGRREELMLKPLPPSKTKWIFCYDLETGQRIRDFEIFHNRIFFKDSYRSIQVDYTFNYEDKIKVIEVGNRLFNGFLRLDGKMSVKDEKTGEVSSALLELPKIKLSSSLSVRLGKNYENSIVSDFYFIGYPDESRRREEQSLAYITFLETELTGDYI